MAVSTQIARMREVLDGVEEYVPRAMEEYPDRETECSVNAPRTVGVNRVAAAARDVTELPSTLILSLMSGSTGAVPAGPRGPCSP